MCIKSALTINAIALSGCVVVMVGGCSDTSAAEGERESVATMEQVPSGDAGTDARAEEGQTYGITNSDVASSGDRDAGASAVGSDASHSNAAVDSSIAQDGGEVRGDAAVSEPQSTTQSPVSTIDAGHTSTVSEPDATADAGADLCVSSPLPIVYEAATVLTEGHSDAVTVALDCEERQLRLSVGEGDRSTGLVTRRSLDSVLIQAGDAALFSWPEDTSYLPAGFEWLGTPGEPLWILPEVQEPDVIWAGFESYGVPPELLPDGFLELRLLSVEGPGKFNLYSNGIGFGLEFMFSPEQDIWTWRVEGGVHRHFDWSFTAQGLYRLTFQASAIVNGVQVESPPQTLRVFIGELADIPETEPTVLKINGARASYAIGETVTLTAEQYGAASDLPAVWYQSCPVEGELSERLQVSTGPTMDFELTVEDLPCVVGLSLLDDGREVVVAQTVSHGDFIDWSTFVPNESQQ